MRSGSIVAIGGLALVTAATLYPFDFSFDEPISFSNRFRLSRTIESRGNDLIIGADAALHQPFRGKIEELRIYRTALAPLHIAQEAKITPGIDSVKRPMEGLVASYSFNEISRAVLKDDSGNGNDGRLQNGQRRSGRALHFFDGLGDYVRVPNSPSIDIGGQSLSILMRIELWDDPSDGVILAKPWHRGVMQYPYYQYGVEFHGSGGKSVGLYLGDTSGRMRGPFSVQPPLGAWTHVAFVYDGAVRAYVDGREELVVGLGDPWDLDDIVINLLLFVPLGFGLVMMARGKGLRPERALLLVLVLGAVVSSGVEVLQCWLPFRQPSLIDIATNSTSAILGALLYLVAGRQDLTGFERFLG
jgi:VanZ family protein